MNDDATSAAAPRRRSRLPGFTFCMALAPLLVVQLGLLWLIQDDAGVTLPDLADDLVRKRLAAAGIRCDWSRARIAFSGRVELTDARVGGGVDDPVFAAKRLVAVLDPYDLIFAGKVTPRRLWLDEGRLLCPAYGSPSGAPETALDHVRAAIRREGDRLVVHTLQAKCGDIPIVAHGRLLPSVAKLEPGTRSGKKEADPLRAVVVAAAKIVALKPVLKNLEGAALELTGTDAAGGIALSLDGAAATAAYAGVAATDVRLHLGAFWGDAGPQPEGRAVFVIGSATYTDNVKGLAVTTGKVSLRTAFGPGWTMPTDADATVHDGVVNGAPVERLALKCDWTALPRLTLNADGVWKRARLVADGRLDTETLAATFDATLVARPDDLRAYPLFPKTLPSEIASLAFADTASLAGRVELGPQGAFRRATARLETGGLSVGNLAFEALAADADITPGHIAVRNIDGIAAHQRVTGAVTVGTADDSYRVLLRGRASPEQVAPFVGTWWNNIWKDLVPDPAHPPYADVDVDGKWTGVPYEFIYIGASAEKLSYRGRTFDRASVRVTETPARLAVGDLVARNADGTGATGHLEWDYRLPDHTLEAVRFRFDGKIPLATAAQLGGDDVVSALSDLTVEKPAVATVIGRYDGPAGAHPDRDTLEVRVQIDGPFTAWKVPGTDFRGTVLVDGPTVRVQDAAFGYAGGAAKADLRIRRQPDGFRLTFDAAVDRADREAFFDGLGKLQDKPPAPKPAPPPAKGPTTGIPSVLTVGVGRGDVTPKSPVPATLTGRLFGRIRLPDITTLDGVGRAEIVDLDLFRVPLFGVLTRGLEKMGINAGNYRFDSAGGDFVIRNGKVWFPALTIRGREAFIKASGRYALADDGLYFRAVLTPKSPGTIPILSWVKDQVNKTARLFPVDIRGTLDKPEWSLDPSPDALFNPAVDASLGTPPPAPADDGRW